MLIASLRVAAQESPSTYFLTDIPQAVHTNPAIGNKTGKMVVSVPFLSGISTRWTASVPLNALFYEGFSYSFDRLYRALDASGKINSTAGASLLFASIGHQRYTFTLSVADRLFTEGIFDREIIRFIRDGNNPYYGKDANLGSLTYYFTQYREIAPGFSMQLHDQLEIGIRPKLLFGRFRFETEEFNLSLYTDHENQLLLLETDGTFAFSGPYDHVPYFVTKASTFKPNIYPGDYFFQFRNLGAAMDLGLVFRPGKSSEIAFSILDIGLIGFKYNGYDIHFVRPLEFRRYNLYQSIDPEGEHYVEPKEALINLIDSLSYTHHVNDARVRNITSLPLKIYLAGKYQVSKLVSAGFSNQFTHFHLQSQNLFTAFIATNVNPSLGIYGSASVINTDVIVPGFGAEFHTQWLQVFFTTQNILGIFQPAASKHLNLCFGINFLFDVK